MVGCSGGRGAKEAPDDEQARVCEALSQGVPGAGSEGGSGRRPDGLSTSERKELARLRMERVELLLFRRQMKTPPAPNGLLGTIWDPACSASKFLGPTWDPPSAPNCSDLVRTAPFAGVGVVAVSS